MIRTGRYKEGMPRSHSSSPLLPAPPLRPSLEGEIGSAPGGGGGGGFESHARDVAVELQSAMAELVTQGAGRVRKAVEIQQRLGLDKSQAWKLFRVITAENLLAEADKVPRRPTMQRLLQAAEERGVRAEVIGRVTTAYEAFQDFVHEHAGSRESFQAIAAALSPEQSDPFGVAYRKGLFQHQSQLLGRKAETVCRCVLLRDGKTEAEESETFAVTGSFGLRPLRQGLSVRIGMRYIPPDRDAAEQKQTVGTPMPVLLRDFCRGNISSPKSSIDEEFNQTIIKLDDLGKNGAVDWAMYTHSPLRRPEDTIIAALGISVPCEVLYGDLLVPAGQTDPATANMRVYYGMSEPTDSRLQRTEDLLPIREVVTYRGRVRPSAMPVISEVPRYAEMIDYVARRIGCADAEFDLYRYRIEYPILYSATVQTVSRVKPPSA